jgi:soluble lytic murein transglycosylase-like protein
MNKAVWFPKKSLSLSFLLAFGMMSASLALAEEARIYVIREADGVIRFTNRRPSPGVSAEVFTARSRSLSFVKETGTPRSLRRFADVGLYEPAIEEAAKEHSVDPALIKAVIHVESAFNPRAVSPKGAMGLMQLMPGTARMLGVHNAFSPEHNIKGGVAYLANLLRRYGKLEYALAAYNAGDVPVQRHGGVPPYSETQDYVRRVLQMKKQYTAPTHG